MINSQDCVKKDIDEAQDVLYLGTRRMEDEEINEC